LKNLLQIILLLLAAWVGSAAAYPTSDEVVEIRGVIHRQIDALRRDDARRAFALVSPGVQAQFGTPERFLEAVRTSYRPVYRPLGVVFLAMTVLGGEVVQEVRLTDHRGAVWLAYYAMQRQNDGSWRMNGCHLVQPARTIPA
jgi:hypothetical protein